MFLENYKLSYFFFFFTLKKIFKIIRQAGTLHKIPLNKKIKDSTNQYSVSPLVFTLRV